MGTKRRRRMASMPVDQETGLGLRSPTQDITPQPSGVAEAAEQEALALPAAEVRAIDFVLPALDGEAPLIDLAAVLTKRREALGMSIADVSRTAHMSPRTISRIEQEPLDQLDAPFYVKNRLRLYACALGLDSADVTGFFEAALRSQHPTRTQSRKGDQVRPYLPLVIGVGVAMAVMVMVLLILW